MNVCPYFIILNSPTIMKAIPFLATLSCLLAMPTWGKEAQTGVWGDQGDGTFRNPILAGDYSDPDPIRVGKDYYMASSTFACSPGVTILHSRDLVNWETIGAAFSDLSLLEPRFNWDKMDRYSKGLYAPSMRYHDGKFWIFVNDYTGGFYCCTALNPAGPWKVTQMLDKNRKPLRPYGWTDPCPFWDDDGKAYLASSRPGKQWFGYLFEMTPDGTQLLDADSQKMSVADVKYAYPEGGTLFSPFHSTEGNKIYKRNGYYYLIHIEFTNGGNGMGTYVLRSKHIYGTRADGSPGKPGDVGTYELFKFGPVGPRDSDQKIPGQGGLVDTPDGQWFWMAQFNHSGSDGRRPTLTPVTWIEDWPVPGVNIKDKQGDFAWQLPKPIQGSTVKFPFSSDDFDKPALNPCWLWNHQPRADKWSLTERPGFLRLHAFKPAGLKDPDEPVKFFRVANVINQRHFRSELTRATFKLDLSGMADGQEAGIAHFNGGQNNASLGVSQKGELKILKYEENGKLTPGPELPKGATMIWMRSTVKMDDRNVYEYSLDGETFLPFGGTYRLSTAGWRGDMIGTYTFNSLGEAGYVDVDSFQYEVHNAPAAKTQ
jgi:beta-xylosidase